MIVFDVYSGDDNELLKHVQHDAYWQNVGLIFKVAKNAFIHADNILNTNLLIAERLRPVELQDHRVLQDAHDLFAAAYRHECDTSENSSILPIDEQREAYLLSWNEWYASEINTVISCSPQFVRAVVESVLFTNTVMGYMAERDVCNSLIQHYNVKSWANPGSYVEVFASDRA